MTTLYDTGIYTLPSDVNLDKLFGNRGSRFLKSEPNARLYSMFDGNETLKCREPITPSKCYEMPVIKYQNNAVYSDFPRGAGMLDTTFMWADATYDQMRQAVERQNAEVPEFMALAPPLRKRIFDLGAMTGGTAKLVAAGIQKYKTAVQLEKDEKLITYLRSLGVNEAEIDDILEAQRAEEITNSLSATAAGLTNTDAKKLFTAAVIRSNNRKAMAGEGVPLDEDDAESLASRNFSIGSSRTFGSDEYERLSPPGSSRITHREDFASDFRRRHTLPPSGSLNTAQQVALPTNVPHRMPTVFTANRMFGDFSFP